MSTSSPAFSHLFEPLLLRGKRLKNRIMSSGHDTSMPTDNLVNDQLIAYHQARAAGGRADRAAGSRCARQRALHLARVDGHG